MRKVAYKFSNIIMKPKVALYTSKIGVMSLHFAFIYEKLDNWNNTINCIFVIRSFWETHFRIKTSDKISRCFDLTEIIFKYKKKWIKLKILFSTKFGVLALTSAKGEQPIIMHLDITYNWACSEWMKEQISQFRGTELTCRSCQRDLTNGKCPLFYGPVYTSYMYCSSVIVY